MTLMRRITPASEEVAFRDAFDRIFDERFLRPIWRWGTEHEAVPALDLFTTPDAVIAKIALPGVEPEKVDVSIADDVVTIRGSYEGERETADSGYVRKELTRGAFHRTFELPTSVKVEASTATFHDGLLTLTLPKAESARPKRVKIDVKR